MTNRETAQIMTILQAVYPDSFKTQSAEMLQATVKVWSLVFADDAFETVQAAVMAHISGSTERFMPPPGVIKQRIISMTTDADLTAQEAWQLVNAATQRGLYNAREEYEKLPPVVQRVVGSPSQLKEWAMMDAETVQSVVASNFQRSYMARAERERECMALPSTMRETVSRIAGQMGIPALSVEVQHED